MPGAGCGPASESYTQTASAGSRSMSSLAARTTSWTGVGHKRRRRTRWQGYSRVQRSRRTRICRRPPPIPHCPLRRPPRDRAPPIGGAAERRTALTNYQEASSRDSGSPTSPAQVQPRQVVPRAPTILSTCPPRSSFRPPVATYPACPGEDPAPHDGPSRGFFPGWRLADTESGTLARETRMMFSGERR